MSRLLRLNSPTAIWWQFSVRAQEQSACDTVGIHTCMGVSYLPLLSFTSWMIRGLRVTIPVPRGRKSLLQRKKRIWRRIHTHACTHAQQTDARLPCIVRRTCIFGLEHVHTAAVRNLLKVSRAQRASEFLGFPLRRSASSAKNKTQENSDIFDQYKNG